VALTHLNAIGHNLAPPAEELGSNIPVFCIQATDSGWP